MIGAPPTETGATAAAHLAQLYGAWVPESKIIVSGLWSAELSKMTANAFLAQRISSINAISALCEKTGADIQEVAFAIGFDSRIGSKCLEASVGFGGACYETHLRNLVYVSRHYRLKEVATYWESVLRMNTYQKRRFATQIVGSMFNTVSGKKLAVFGFSYKKNTSDIRDTPAIDICRALLAEKAQLAMYDPRVAEQAIQVALTSADGQEQHIDVDSDPYIAASGAHAIVLLTEWDQFHNSRLDYQRIYATMQQPAFIFDGRNLLDHEALRQIGFQVFGIGKPRPPQKKDEEALAREQMEQVALEARVRAGAAKPAEASSPKPPADSPVGLASPLRDPLSETIGMPPSPSPLPPFEKMETFGAMA